MFRSFANPRIVLIRTHPPPKSHHTTELLRIVSLVMTGE
jgi:hypothetical protein